MKYTVLSDICEISSGGTPSRGITNYYQGEIPWAKISDIENAENGVIFDTEEKISVEGLKSIRNKLFPKGTLLFAMYGSIGKVAIAGRELSTNQAILGIRAKNNDQINLKYLKIWFERNKQKLINRGRGVALQNLSATIVRSLEIPLPPLDDQIRIATVLTRAEKLIAKRKESIKALDELLRSTFFEMFGDYSLMLQQPKTKLNEFIIFLTSGSRGWAQYYSETGDVFIRINNVRDAYFKLDDIMYITPPDNAEAVRTKVRTNDLLLSITADLGRTAVVNERLNGAFINQHLALIRLKQEKMNPVFVAWYFAMPYGKSIVMKKNREGVKAGLNFDDIRGFEIVTPPLTLQNQFATIVEKVESIKTKYTDSLVELENLYGSLSQQAFKGKLDLSKIPVIYEMEAVESQN